MTPEAESDDPEPEPEEDVVPYQVIVMPAEEEVDQEALFAELDAAEAAKA